MVMKYMNYCLVNRNTKTVIRQFSSLPDRLEYDANIIFSPSTGDIKYYSGDVLLDTPYALLPKVIIDPAPAGKVVNGESLVINLDDVTATLLYRDKTTEETRQEELDATITGDPVTSPLKTMTNAEFDAWWEANVTNAAQAIGVLKRLTKLVIRRLL